MTPEERAALVAGITDAYNGAASDQPALTGPAVTEPRVPAGRAPDVKAAELKLSDAANERYALSDTAHAPLRAQDTVAGVEDRPLPTTTSWADQLARSFLPQVEQRDERPSSAAEIAEANATNLPQTAAEIVLGPVADPRVRAYVRKTLHPDVLMPEPEVGTPTENGVLYLMRLLGTVAPAVVGETVERAPAPDVAGAAEAYAQQEGAAEIARRFFTPSTVGQQVLGYDPNVELKVDRGSQLGNWSQGVLERIERGQAFETDLQRAFKARLGDDWENTGWWLGLGLDVFGDWEGALAKGPRVAARIYDSAKALGELAPAGLAVERSPVWAAIQGNELAWGRWMGDKSATEILADRMSPDQLPARVRQFVEEAGQNDYGMSLKELLDEERSQPPPASPSSMGSGASSPPAGPAPRPPPALPAPAPLPSPGFAPVSQLEARVKILEQAHANNVAAAAQAHAEQESLKGFVRGAQEGHARDLEGQALQKLRDADLVQSTATALRNTRGSRYSIPLDRTRPAAEQRAAREAAAQANQIQKAEAAEAEAAQLRQQALELHGQAQSVRYRTPQRGAFVPPTEPEELGAARLELDRARRGVAAHNAAEARPLIETADQGAGFRKIQGALEQNPEDKAYLVKNRKGEIVSEGSLADVLPDATRKPERGLEVWYSTIRPVARWGPSGFKADHLFASDVERLIVDRLRAADPGLATAVADHAPRPLAPTEVVGHVLGDFVSDAPVPSDLAGVRQSRAADIIRKGYALAARDALGTDRLKQLPGVFTMVAKEDHQPILDKAQQIRAGLTVDDAERFLRGEQTLTSAQDAVWRRLVPGFDPAQASAKDWNDLYHASVKEAGGFLTDARYRIQGNRAWSDRFRLYFTDRHIRERAGDTLVARGPLGFLAHHLLESFAAEPTARLPEPARVALKELRTAVQTEINALMRAIRRGGRPVEDILRDAVIDLRLPHPDEIERAQLIRGGAGLPAHLDALRQSWRDPVRPSWLDTSDPVAAAAGLHAWSDDLLARMRRIAQDWVLTHLALDGAKAEEGSDLYNQVRQLGWGELERIYTEFIRKGDPNGPELATVLARFRHKPADPMSALAQWTIAARAKSKAGEVLDRLVFEGLGVRASDPRLGVLRAVLTDEHRAWNPTAARWDHLFTDAETTWAVRTLKGWAIEPGKGTASTLKAVNFSDVLVPRFLADEANRLIKVGVVRGSAQLTPYKVLNNLFILWKQVATHGFLIPNAAHFVGQMVGLVPTMVTTLGYKGAASALGRLLWTDSALVGELVTRVGGRSWPTFRPRAWEAMVLRAGDHLYTLNDLEDVARSFALGETRPDFEVANQIAELLQGEPGNGPMAWNKLQQGAKWWQDLIQQTAGAFDLHGRMATYLDGVRQGMPLEQAAMRARAALLDFRELTPFESTYMRLVFTFYAYMRKNVDAYLAAFLRDPSVVTSQARLVYRGMKDSGLSGVQLGALTDSDVSRLVVYSSDQVTDKNGRPNRLYDRNWVSSSPISVGEALSTLRMLLPLPRLGLDWRGDLQSLNPGAQALAVLALGRRLDRDIDRPWNNKIPPFLMDIPVVGRWLGDAVGAGPEPLTTFDDPLLGDDDASSAMGVPAYWAAGTQYDTTDPDMQDAQRRLWQELSLWVGRPFSTLEGVAEGLGFERPPPFVTQGEALFDALLGFKHRPVMTPEESVRRHELRVESDLRSQADVVRPPQGVGPR